MRFKSWHYPEIKENTMTKYHWLVQHVNNFSLGEQTDIGAFTYINAKNGVVIERNVQIGSHCSIYSISTIDNKEGKVVIKENSCVGSHCTVMPGISIGKNSIVGAHSFVNRDIPDNCIAFGIPVRVEKILKK